MRPMEANRFGAIPVTHNAVLRELGEAVALAASSSNQSGKLVQVCRISTAMEIVRYQMFQRMLIPQPDILYTVLLPHQDVLQVAG